MVVLNENPASEQPSIDEAKLNAFIGKAVDDWGALTSAALVVIGDKLGLYSTLADRGPATPAELAQRTNTGERYIRPWLINQAAGGYIEYEPSSGQFRLPPEHALALATLAGGYHLMTAALKADPRISGAFKSGEGMLWAEHDPALFTGTESFFRPRLRAEPGPELDTRPGWRRGQARGRRHGRRRWLRARCLNANHGTCVPALAFLRVR